ncbi:MAG: Holliday junction resolvase RuvX [bacterium]|nr:Holliday junction resolvase RuvX [bacterium]
MKTLGIDYGTVRVGTAISYASLAEPLQILDQGPQLLAELENIIRQHKVQQLVIGISENEMAAKSQAFAAIMREKFQLPVYLEDETLSSYQVHQFLKLHRLKDRRGPIDHLAAAVILQNFLDEQT